MNLDEFPILRRALQNTLGENTMPGMHFALEIDFFALDIDFVEEPLPRNVTENHTVTVGEVSYGIFFSRSEYLPSRMRWRLEGIVLSVDVLPTVSTAAFDEMWLRPRLGTEKKAAPGCNHDPVVKRKRAIVL